MITHQRNYEHRYRSGCRTDHARTPADHRNDHGNREAGIEPDPRIDTGNDRETDGFGNQRQRNDQSGQKFGLGIRQPVAPKITVNRHEQPPSNIRMLRRNIEKTCLWRKGRIQSSLEARPRTRY